MSDLIKYEFIKTLDELEELSIIFDNLQAETAALKQEYAINPNSEELMQRIKIHEQKYKEVYERFVALNEKSKQLKAASDAESEDEE